MGWRMDAVTIADTLFVHTLRRRGFIVSLFLVALLLLSLAVTTAFGLGRELLMVREAGISTLFLASFLGALLTGIHASGADGRKWLIETASRPAGHHALALGRLLHCLLTAFWAALLLVPFFAASLALFHGATGAGLLCLVMGIASLPVSMALEARWGTGAVPMILPVLLASAGSLPFLASLPGSRDLYSVFLLLPVPLLIAGLIPGVLTVLFPGPAGWVASGALFLLANMRESLVGDHLPGILARMLPDLSNLNPAIVITRPIAMSWGDTALAFGYAILLGLASVLLTLGGSSLRAPLGNEPQ